MEVILLQPVRKLGNVGDVVKVKNGYARNYLIPSNIALRSTKDNVAYFEAKKSEIEKENKQNQNAAQKIAQTINEKFIVLTRQAGEDGRLYGSVTSLDIARELSETSKQDLDRKQVSLNSPIKYIGIYTVDLHLHGDVSAQINVNVARTETEAKDAEKSFRHGEKVMEGPSAEDEAKADTNSIKEEVKEEDQKAVEEKLDSKEEEPEENKDAKTRKD